MKNETPVWFLLLMVAIFITGLAFIQSAIIFVGLVIIYIGANICYSIDDLGDKISQNKFNKKVRKNV